MPKLDPAFYGDPGDSPSHARMEENSDASAGIQLNVAGVLVLHPSRAPAARPCTGNGCRFADGTGRRLEQAVKLGRGTTFQEREMVEIKERSDGVSVQGKAFNEVFRNRFKALMAAYAVAMTEATTQGTAITITVPPSWGDAIIVEPCPISRPS